MWNNLFRIEGKCVGLVACEKDEVMLMKLNNVKHWGGVIFFIIFALRFINQ